MTGSIKKNQTSVSRLAIICWHENLFDEGLHIVLLVNQKDRKRSGKMMKKNFKKIGAIFVVTIGIILILVFIIGPIITRPIKELSPLAKEWQDSGEYIQWSSTIEENASFGEVNIFTIQKGNPENPAVLFIHGYPTMSFDFTEVMELLCDEYYVCAIDTIGYGLSDKPKDGYIYSLADDAKLINHYISNILKLEELTLVTHDKGDSVGLSLLSLYKEQDIYTINQHIITNGNIYLPLANLTNFQKLLLNHTTGPIVTKYVNGTLIAEGLNEMAHTILESDEKVAAIASIIDHEDGGEVQYGTIQYLNQRSQYEMMWLENLRNSVVPTTLFWGTEDDIAPVAVPDYVWRSILSDRGTEASYYQLPNADHYLMNDNPMAFSMIIRQANGEEVDWESLPVEQRPIFVDENPGR